MRFSEILKEIGDNTIELLEFKGATTVGEGVSVPRTVADKKKFFVTGFSLVSDDVCELEFTDNVIINGVSTAMVMNDRSSENFMCEGFNITYIGSPRVVNYSVYLYGYFIDIRKLA